MAPGPPRGRAGEAEIGGAQADKTRAEADAQMILRAGFASRSPIPARVCPMRTKCSRRCTAWSMAVSAPSSRISAQANGRSQPSAAHASYRTDSARRYSPLGQITPENVDELERAWTFHTGDLPEDNFGAETTPIKIGDSLYLCSGMNIMFALDPVTGRQRWRYDPQVSEEWIPYTAACRGVAYYAVPGADPNSLCATRIIEGTLDGRIIAVDARIEIDPGHHEHVGVLRLLLGARIQPGNTCSASCGALLRHKASQEVQ